jgi:hypothetical protein
MSSVHPASTAPAGGHDDAANRDGEAQHERGEKERVVGPRCVLRALLGMFALAVRVRGRIAGP